MIACRAVRRSSGHLGLFKLALVLVGVVAAIAVTGASGADFDNDNGPCPGTSGNPILSRCPTAFVGVKYEIQLVSEEDSGCVPYDWFEIVNSSLPAGLTMTRDGLISGVPTSAGFVRFWVWDHDLTAAEGGPDWCQFEDESEREFSIPVDPGLAIDNETVKGATIGQAYSQTLTAKQVVSLNPRTGDPVQATWSLLSGALPPGITLSESGALTGTPTSEGSYQFVVKAFTGSPFDTKTYTLSVRQPVSVKSPLGPALAAERRSRDSLREDLHRDGRERHLHMGAYVRCAAIRRCTRREQRHDQRNSSSGREVRVCPHRDRQRGARRDRGGVDDRRPATRDQDTSLEDGTAGKRLRGRARNDRRRAAREMESGERQAPAGVRFAPRLGSVRGNSSPAGTFRVAVEASDALGAKARKALVLKVES